MTLSSNKVSKSDGHVICKVLKEKVSLICTDADELMVVVLKVGGSLGVLEDDMTKDK